MYDKNAKGEVIDILLEDIGDRYGELRIIAPQADASICKSIEKYGQLSPVVVCLEKEKGYELIDGFKRLRAARRLDGVKSLKAISLDAGNHAGKAAILQLNWACKSISDMEEAMVVHSLFREDSLTQVEIAVLLDRHKSWVCRRVALVERLCDEVKSHLKLGLITVSIGREVAKLPRGNQEAALLSIQKHRLTRRQTEKLVSLLLSRPKHEHENMLRCPDEVLNENCTHHTKINNNQLSQQACALNLRLASMESSCLSVAKGVSADSMALITMEDILYMSPMIKRTVSAAELAVHNLKQISTRNES